MREKDLRALEEKCRRMRVAIVKMLHNAGSGHTGGSLSAVEIVTALYFHKMRHRPEDPKWPGRDRFILSKGHAAPVLYAALAISGYFPEEELWKLRKLDALLQGHPDPITPGVEVPTGSLGQGLSMANGIAMALRIDGKPNRVYVLLGDGECQEGMVWEAAMTAAQHGLDNVCAFLDHNGLQIDGPVAWVKEVMPLEEKWRAFGWNVINVDGHDLGGILDALEEAERARGRPTMVIARTVKGKGASVFEHRFEFHGKAPDEEQVKTALAELGEKECGRHHQHGFMEHPKKKKKDPSLRSTRDACGEALRELGRSNPDVVALSADLAESTRMSAFAECFPGRFFQMGIAEADMMGTAAGLAAAGKIPFAATFAVFAAGRAFDQVRQSIALPSANVKIIASHGGVTVGEDGASHQAIEDVALMRVLPNMTVVVPADALEAAQAVKAAVEHKGPVYIRVSRAETPLSLPDGCSFEIGKARILKDGRNAVIFASGVMVGEALGARDLLMAEGISVRVVNVSTIKPLDAELVGAAARGMRVVFAAEEHSVVGGLGSAVAEALCDRSPGRLVRIGVPDRFGTSGTPAELLEKFGLDAAGIARSVRAALTAAA